GKFICNASDANLLSHTFIADLSRNHTLHCLSRKVIAKRHARHRRINIFIAKRQRKRLSTIICLFHHLSPCYCFRLSGRRLRFRLRALADELSSQTTELNGCRLLFTAQSPGGGLPVNSCLKRREQQGCKCYRLHLRLIALITSVAC